MKTSIYIPDDLYNELKGHNAPFSAISQAALEDWLTTQADPNDPVAALRLIETGTRRLRAIAKQTTVTPPALLTQPTANNTKRRPRRKTS